MLLLFWLPFTTYLFDMATSNDGMSHRIVSSTFSHSPHVQACRSSHSRAHLGTSHHPRTPDSGGNAQSLRYSSSMEVRYGGLESTRRRARRIRTTSYPRTGVIQATPSCTQAAMKKQRSRRPLSSTATTRTMHGSVACWSTFSRRKPLTSCAQ